MELILMDLKKRKDKEKSIRNKVLLEKAINALDDYRKSTEENVI